ncbi:XRE family transcriptional regulator [Rhizobium sp. AU243]|uniref:helix-turn-helix domain-containing protein n=1 Tax=Rhizobium sp. AU243 TaxID=2303425 RepID=UPI0010CB2C76|nr:XRE family transcriptional regulator [Rhizobium sp. AU243]TKV70765.1 XRE family transcriptional regulator [Rhizobium sp. AU243]
MMDAVSQMQTTVQLDIDLGSRVREIRTRNKATINDVATRSGLSKSTISKIENNQLSPTYENIIRLARGLQVDISFLFSDTAKNAPRGRRSLTPRGGGNVFRTQNYDYEMLCTDLVGKKMQPLKAIVKAREVRDFGGLITHDGEEVILVLSGEIELHTEFYAPAVLRSGDCAYFDSTMGHVCVVHGKEDAEIFWVCSSADVIGLVTAE